MRNGVKNIQAAGYNGVRVVLDLQLKNNTEIKLRKTT